MRYLRREFLLGLVAATVPIPVDAQRVGSAPWVELLKVLGDIGDSLDTFTAAVGKITVRTVGGYTWLKDRNVRAGLVILSGRLTALIADQENVKLALDRFGDTWRRSNLHGHRPTASQQSLLSSQWDKAVGIVRVIASRTIEMLADVRSQENDVDLEDAYSDLQNALVAKGSVLTSITMMPQPDSSADIGDLVNAEETFLGLRAATRRAQQALNEAIRRMPR